MPVILAPVGRKGLGVWVLPPVHDRPENEVVGGIKEAVRYRTSSQNPNAVRGRRQSSSIEIAALGIVELVDHLVHGFVALHVDAKIELYHYPMADKLVAVENPR